MEKIKNYVNERKPELLIIVLLLGTICFLVWNSYFKKNENLLENDDANLISDNLEKVEESSNVSEEKYILVDIKGEVKKPGVYKLKENSRVIDAINASGGLTKKSYTKYINLSRILKDENVIIVNSTSEIKKVSSGNNITEVKINNNSKNSASISESELITNDNVKSEEDNTGNSLESNQKVNINTATKEELMKLSNIGESKAEKIIDYRTANGNFNSIEDIKKVSGIGDKLYDSIKENITV